MRINKLIFCVAILLNSIAHAQTNSMPDLVNNNYPRAFFFRSSEGLVTLGYQDWEKNFNRLGGIIGKVMDEEIVGRSKSLPFFQRFKKDHKNQAVLLHYNGNARDPRDAKGYYQGHWIYYNGSLITQNVTEDASQITIKVADASLYVLTGGRNKASADDLGICRVDENGKPDWNYAEQLQLKDIDLANNILTVTRAAYGTKPLRFEAGKAMVAAHVSEGPWGEKNNILWFYNHSTTCPKDAEGRTCDDVLSKELGGYFAKGGPLEVFDGVEFDVIFGDMRHGNLNTKRQPDVNNDGKGDYGFVNGINVYLNGTFDLCRLLRKEIPANKLVMADGMQAIFQRATPYLNGIESEGWPHLRDPQVEDWSGGWNRHLFWNKNALPPVFNYVNFKYVENMRSSPVAFHRLVWATAQLMDAYMTNGEKRIPKTAEGIVTMPIDEMVAGTEQKKNWLGKPIGPTVRLALQQPDLLRGEGKKIPNDFVKKISVDSGMVSKVSEGIKVTGSGTDSIKFSLNNIPANGPDLVISITVKADARKGYPANMPRLLEMNTDASTFRQMTWVNSNWFTAVFYLRDVKSNNLNLHFYAEGIEAMYVKDITVHAYPDVIYREFENGLILANPAYHNYKFNVASLTVGKKFCRITATEGQDATVNDGRCEGDEIELNERTGLFLKRRK